MKTMNFTCKEILPSLLDKSKSQTIRKAWGIAKKYKIPPEQYDIPKPAKFKVGDKAKIVWDEKEEGYYNYCCKNCGKSNKITEVSEWGGMMDLECKKCYSKDMFRKDMGVVEITEVFKIEIDKERVRRLDNAIAYFHSCEGLAKLDGFKSAKDMFKYLDEQYDLSTAKEFYVYRWRWIK